MSVLLSPSLLVKLKMIFKRGFSQVLGPSFVTTPIFYVNAKPHIGHLYSALVADAVCRFKNLTCSRPGVFTTGTDEHGIKIQQAAAKNNTPVADYCDTISKEYKTLFRKYDVNYTDYIRTTEQRHAVAVSKFWSRLQDRGFLYKREYAGYYCVPDETFLTEAQLTTSPKTGEKVSAESGHPVEWTQEENYMFKLGSVQDGIVQWLKEGEGDRVHPKKFERILYDFLAEPLPDISVSRPANRVHWGIPVPGDNSQTIYVWLNALVNYLTCSGYPDELKMKPCWPPTLQVIGKDILKFHGIYWPGFLIAADLEPPKQLLCHSHWTVDGQKMSKSKGNVVDPMERAGSYTPDGLRYFLLREAVLHSDGNYSDAKVKRIINAELADTFGNLLSRCSAKSLNPDERYPEYSEEDLFKLIQRHGEIVQKLLDSTSGLAKETRQHYEEVSFHSLVDLVMGHLHLTNNFFETLKPWEMKKGMNRRSELNCTLLLAMESLRVASIILQPIIPSLTAQLLDKLNVTHYERKWSNAEKFIWSDQGEFPGRSLHPDISPLLFKRII